MASEKKLRKSFRKVKQDIDYVRYSTFNSLRYLDLEVKEQGFRIKELERRLAQVERLNTPEQIIR